MRIKIAIPEELLDEDIEIILMGLERFQEVENENNLNGVDQDEKLIGKTHKAVLRAFQMIFTEEKYRKLHAYQDYEGKYYTHPGDVAKIANELIDLENVQDDDEEEGQSVRRKKWLTSPGVGRCMKNDLGLVPDERKNTGIPYYWEDNKDLVEKLLSLPVMSPNNQFEEENKAAEVRLGSLEALEPKCNWSSPCPTREEQEARERWKWLMDRQSEFEEKWDL